MDQTSDDKMKQKEEEEEENQWNNRINPFVGTLALSDSRGPHY